MFYHRSPVCPAERADCPLSFDTAPVGGLDFHVEKAKETVMKCARHPDVEAVAVCVNCGKALCPECRNEVDGKSYCRPCSNKFLAVGTARAKRSGKLAAGGVLGIAAGLVGFIGAASFIADSTGTHSMDDISTGLEVVLGIALIFLGIVAVVGSIFALSRKHFWLAIAGGICAFLTFWLAGIPALVLIIASRDEFKAPPKQQGPEAGPPSLPPPSPPQG